MDRKQAYSCALTDTLLAEVGGVPLDALHRDVDAILHCNEAAKPVAERLGLPAPQPKLAGFSYSHVSALGAEVVFAEGSEPNVFPMLHAPADIDELREPEDYMNAGIVAQRRETMEALVARCPGASRYFSGGIEGPATTAGLLMGQDFFMLPYEDPERAHRLLSFCTESALNFMAAERTYFGQELTPKPGGICDDFAGMFSLDQFEEFVMPYWDRLYEGMRAAERHLHSELLRQEHLPYLKDMDIAVFDPSADQYVTPQLLRDHCPVPFTSRILSWTILNHSEEELQRIYRETAACGPVRITFNVTCLEQEPKIAALLEVARELG